MNTNISLRESSEQQLTFKQKFKVIDWSKILFEIGSDTFRHVLIYGKEQEPRKKIFHNGAKNSPFLRGFDRMNMFFGISRNLTRKVVFK